MGLLGISLLFVGITLVSNGVARLQKTEGRALIFINAVTGLLIIIGNLIFLSKAAAISDFNNNAAGFLFGVTYLFIAANYAFKINDLRPFGWFSLGVAIFAAVMSVMSFTSGVIGLGILWAAWAVLWLEGFVELVLKVDKLSKVFPYLSILEGIFAAFVPAVLMLLGVWK